MKKGNNKLNKQQCCVNFCFKNDAAELDLKLYCQQKY